MSGAPTSGADERGLALSFSPDGRALYTVTREGGLATGRRGSQAAPHPHLKLRMPIRANSTP
jgi:hypothetical protein